MMTENDIDRLGDVVNAYRIAFADPIRDCNPEWSALCAVVQDIIDRHVYVREAELATDTATEAHGTEPPDAA